MPRSCFGGLTWGNGAWELWRAGVFVGGGGWGGGGGGGKWGGGGRGGGGGGGGLGGVCICVGGSGGGGGELGELWWLGELEGVQDGGLFGEGGGAAPDGAGLAGEGAQVHAVELVAQVAPGVAGGGLGEADEQQGQPAQQHVGADAPFEVVVDGAQVEGRLDVPPASFDLEELLVAEGDVLGGQGWVGAAQQELAVESLLGGD